MDNVICKIKIIIDFMGLALSISELSISSQVYQTGGINKDHKILWS